MKWVIKPLSEKRILQILVNVWSLQESIKIGFVPIQVTFKEARKNWQNTTADIQSDDFNFIGQNTNYIGSNLHRRQESVFEQFKSENSKNALFHFKEQDILTAWSAIFSIADTAPLMSCLSQYL